VSRTRVAVLPPASPAAALARVEAAMDELRAELVPMLAQEAERLREVAVRARVDAPGARAALPGVAHDLKGLGATCDRPLVTRAAASLERLLAREPGWSRKVALHAAALLALAQDRAPGNTATAERLADALERLAG
jgi:hypothetical protein